MRAEIRRARGDSWPGQDGPESKQGSAGKGPPTITEALSSWSTFMTADGCRPNTIKAFRSLVEKLAAARGWEHVDHINLDDAAAFIAQHRELKIWSGTTADAYAVMMRCFGKHMVRNGWLESNPLQELSMSGEASAAGARPLLFEQARDLVAVFCRHVNDKRASVESAVIAATLFKTGWRPFMLYNVRECDVLLDAPVPYYVTHPSWTKNKRRQEIALDDEAVVLLRWLRGRFGARGTDRLCQKSVTMRTWRKYVLEAGIDYGNPVIGIASPYSGRKSFASWLGRAGTDDGIKQWLLAHYDPYDQPDLRSQAEALARLPRIWPEPAKKFLENREKAAIFSPASPVTPVENSYNQDSADHSPTARLAPCTAVGGSRLEGPKGLSSADFQHDNGRNRAGNVGDRQVLVRALALIERQMAVLECVVESLRAPERAGDAREALDQPTVGPVELDLSAPPPGPRGG